MIFGNVNVLQDMSWLPKPLKLAVDHLKSTDFSTKEAGRYEIQGPDIFVLVSDLTTKPASENRPEIHRNFIDVQYLVHGSERIGVAVDTGRNPVAEDLLAEKDILFYSAMENETAVEMTPGSFAVLFPSDVHRPGCQSAKPETIRKVVVKVRASLLK